MRIWWLLHTFERFLILYFVIFVHENTQLQVHKVTHKMCFMSYKSRIRCTRIVWVNFFCWGWNSYKCTHPSRQKNTQDQELQLVSTPALSHFCSSHRVLLKTSLHPSGTVLSKMDSSKKISELTCLFNEQSWHHGNLILAFSRYRYRDSSFLNTLSSLLTVMYAEEKVQKDFIPLSTLHLMISSHSQFLPTMLGCEEEPDKSQEKGASS